MSHDMGTVPTVPDGSFPPTPPAGSWFLARANLQVLIDLLREDGRTVIGPTVVDGAIVLRRDRVRGRAAGRAGGTSRRRARTASSKDGDRRLFDFTVGPISPKRWTFPPRVPLNVGRRDGRAGHLRARAARSIRRSSPSSASGPASWPRSGSRTACSWVARTPTRTTAPGAATPSWSRSTAPSPASTCFCTSMGTGPEVRGGYDLVADRARRGVPRPGRRPRRARTSSRGCRVRGARRRPDVPRRRGGRQGRRDDRRPGPDRGPPRPAAGPVRQPALGRRSPSAACSCANCTHGLPDLLLQQRHPALRPRRRASSTVRAGLGLLLHGRLRQGRRRQLPQPRRGTATASG